MIKTQAYKCKSRPPDSHDLGKVLAREEGAEAGQTHQPIRTDATKEDHVPFWSDDFLLIEGEDFRLVRLEVEDTSMAIGWSLVLAMFKADMQLVYPVMSPTTNKDPARLPKKVMNQCISILGTLSRRCSTATVVNCPACQLTIIIRSAHSSMHQEATRAQICSSQYNRAETPGKYHGPQHANKTWSVLLIPWR